MKKDTMKEEEVNVLAVENELEKILTSAMNEYPMLENLVEAIEKSINKSKLKDTFLFFARDTKFSQEQIAIREKLITDIATTLKNGGQKLSGEYRCNNEAVTQQSLENILLGALETLKKLYIQYVQDKKAARIAFRDENGKNIDRKKISDADLEAKIGNGEIGTDQYFVLKNQYDLIKETKVYTNKKTHQKFKDAGHGNTRIGNRQL